MKTALITGGTSGIGLATALAFGAQGVKTALTYRWGSADEGQIRARFEAAGAPQPLFFCADTGSAEDTAALFLALARTWGGMDALIINASGANRVGALDDYQLRALQKSLSYSAWPLADHLLAARQHFDRLPRYAVAMSSTGPDSYTMGYDFMAASKAVQETLVRYLSYHLRDEDIRINALRSRAVRTPTFDAAFGDALEAFSTTEAPHRSSRWVTPEDVAGAAWALCSGLLDAVRGQVLTVDRGGAFSDGLFDLYQARRDPTYQVKRAAGSEEHP